MIDTTAALYAFLIDKAAVAAALASYQDTPAIFEETAPDGYTISDPILIIDPPINAPRSDTSTHVIRAFDIRARIYGQVKSDEGATGYADLNTAAETIAAILHNSTPPISGGSTMRVRVDGPSFAPTDSPSIGGRALSIRWTIQEV